MIIFLHFYKILIFIIFEHLSTCTRVHRYCPYCITGIIFCMFKKVLGHCTGRDMFERDFNTHFTFYTVMKFYSTCTRYLVLRTTCTCSTGPPVHMYPHVCMVNRMYSMCEASCFMYVCTTCLLWVHHTVLRTTTTVVNSTFL